MPDTTKQSFLDNARDTLLREWKLAGSPKGTRKPSSSVPAEIVDAIARSVNSQTKTYRYVLPTQVLAKTVDENLDCRCVQAGSGLAGAFDARSLCHGVVVPFENEHNSLLGGSSSPYLNNPLRIPAIVDSELAAQKDKQGFRNLILVLDYVEKHQERRLDVFRIVLEEMHKRMAVVSVIYPVPNRVSLQQTCSILESFLADRSGGLRMQSCAVALFHALGERFALFESVRANNINAADAATGNAADLECLDSSKRIVLAVEVKDRRLRIQDVQDKLPSIRGKGVREVLFVVKDGAEQASADAISDLIKREFVTGQNVYVANFDEFLRAVLILFGEAGRRTFLVMIGQELDERKADFAHRVRWAELLQSI